MNKIYFPERELADIKDRLDSDKDLYSIRVSEEYSKYREGDILMTEWGERLSVVSVRKISGGIESLKREYPFFNELDDNMLAELSPYSDMDIVLMRKTQ